MTTAAQTIEEATAAPAVGALLDRKVRRYPLDVQNCSGYDGYCCMSKGHHGLDDFKAAALAWWGEDMSRWDGPRHEWWRAVPDRSGEYRVIFHPAKPGARGAFPATVMDYY